tara:strand:+ start:78747 stop:79034 length:288 start_codon:yes stop_codon:yes gene_type:complete
MPGGALSKFVDDVAAAAGLVTLECGVEVGSSATEAGTPDIISPNRRATLESQPSDWAITLPPDESILSQSYADCQSLTSSKNGQTDLNQSMLGIE